jgi:hypothetical protein
MSSTSDSDRAGLPREIRELGLHGIDRRSQHVADAGDLEDFVGKPIDHRHRGSDHLLGDGLALIRCKLPNQATDFVNLSFGWLPPAWEALP